MGSCVVSTLALGSLGPADGGSIATLGRRVYEFGVSSDGGILFNGSRGPPTAVRAQRRLRGGRRGRMAASHKMEDSRHIAVFRNMAE